MVVAAGCSKSSGRSSSSRRSSSSSCCSEASGIRKAKRRLRNASYLNLLSPAPESYTDLGTLHKRNCKKYYCLCKKHVVSVICVNETRKLYWFNSRSVEEKISQGLGEGYYNKLLRIVNGALSNWVQRYIDGLGFATKELLAREAKSGGEQLQRDIAELAKRPDIMFKINGSAKGNMKLLKEGCYCHYHPHITADVCNADFLRRVVSRDNETGIDENDDLDALTPGWMVFIAAFLSALSLSLFFSSYLLVFFYPRAILSLSLILYLTIDCFAVPLFYAPIYFRDDWTESNLRYTRGGIGAVFGGHEVNSLREIARDGGGLVGVKRRFDGRIDVVLRRTVILS